MEVMVLWAIRPTQNGDDKTILVFSCRTIATTVDDADSSVSETRAHLPQHRDRSKRLRLRRLVEIPPGTTK